VIAYNNKIRHCAEISYIIQNILYNRVNLHEKLIVSQFNLVHRTKIQKKVMQELKSMCMLRRNGCGKSLWSQQKVKESDLALLHTLGGANWQSNKN